MRGVNGEGKSRVIVYVDFVGAFDIPPVVHVRIPVAVECEIATPRKKTVRIAHITVVKRLIFFLEVARITVKIL